MIIHTDFPEPGELFLDRYQIETVLGAGGFARVYRAKQVDLDRDVAIKVMRPALDTEDATEETTAQLERVEERFRREAKLISKFRSPNTVVVHDYGRTDGGLLYMTLEYVAGETLSALMKREAPLPAARVAHISRQVLNSLHEAHHYDVLHRDIKPQNIMVFNHLGQTDLVKVLDFGIAKVLEVEEEKGAVEELTTDGTLVGTPRYMSPEQIRGGRLSPASDIYSLGLVLFEAVSGHKAVPEATTMRIIAAHLDPRPIEFPDDAAVGAGMRWIVGKMLAKDSGERFQSANEALAAFEQWDAAEPPVAVKRAHADPPQIAAARTVMPTPTIGATQAPRGDDDDPTIAEEAVLLGGFDASLSAEISEGLPPLDEPEAAPVANFEWPAPVDESDDVAVASARLPWVPLLIVGCALLLVTGGLVIALSADEPDEPDAAPELAATTPTVMKATTEKPAPPPAQIDEEPAAVADAGVEVGLAFGDDEVEAAVEAKVVSEGAVGETITAEVVETQPKPKRERIRPKPEPPKKRFFSVERTK